MQRIKTVSTVERIVRNGIFTALLLGYGLYFLYDGYRGYPQKNFERAKAAIPAEAQDAVEISWSLTRAQALAAVKPGEPYAAVVEALGEPAWEGAVEGTQRRRAVWFAPGGVVDVRYSTRGVVLSNAERAWKDGQKKEHDLLVQKVLGFLLVPIGVVLLLRVLLMTVRGAEMTDEGLKPSGQPRIPFESMTGWDASRYRKTGRLALLYERDGKPCTYVLDDYKLAAFKTLVARIVERTGLADPLADQESPRPSG
jgi:hypothetical protein